MEDYKISPILLERKPESGVFSPQTFRLDSIMAVSAPSPYIVYPYRSMPFDNLYGSYELNITGPTDFIAASRTDVYPGLMTKQSLDLELAYRISSFSIAASLEVRRYLYQGVGTQYGVSVEAGYELSDNISFTVFGHLYNVVPFYSMAAYPYTETSEYGGYVTFRKGIWELNVGAMRSYDAIRRRWYVTPIATPAVIVKKKVSVGVPIGEIVRGILTKAVEHNHSRRQASPHGGVIIMPDTSW